MINSIQFQKGLSLADFMARYGTEAQCEAALIKARWPDGFVCPRCGHRRGYAFRHGKNAVWQCSACPHQTSLRSGTQMEHSLLSLRTWMLAIYLITQSKTNIAALALRRQLGISWKAAWLLKHKIMEAMRQREAQRPLSAEVRVDHGWLGGERPAGQRGRGAKSKVAFVAAVELREGRPLRVRFDPVEDFSPAALAQWAARALTGPCLVSMDAFIRSGLLALAPQGVGQMGLLSQDETGVESFRWLNILIGNLKTALSGTHHAFKFAKYANRYLAEVQYRFNRRASLPALVPGLAFAVMHTHPMTRRVITSVPEGGT
ncbi:IS1595 family transposase [Niveibacterium terrae]|uniref:IS1595 family transposase n=1 Tax=Niveibacterium terrae TaxID=3373598 RepID=UPI003A8E5179